LKILILEHIYIPFNCNLYLVPTPDIITPVIATAIAKQFENDFYAPDRKCGYYEPLKYRAILNFTPNIVKDISEWEVWHGITNGTFKKYLLGKHR